MEVFWIWLIGFLITTLTCGVLYHKEIIDWHPKGGCRVRPDGDGPPHMVLGIFWFIALPIAAVVFGVIGIYKGLYFVAEFIAKVRFERGEK